MKYYRLLAALALTFILGIQDGYIALWKDGNPEPVEVFPFKAQMLPETDQKALEEGIQIRDSMELAQLLEDYLS